MLCVCVFLVHLPPHLPRQNKSPPVAQTNLGCWAPRGCESSDRIFVLVPRSDIIPCAFRGLHTVYASGSLTESCFFTVLTPAAQRKIGSNNPLSVPKLLHWMNTSCPQSSDWSLWSLYPTGVQKNSTAQRTKNWYSFKICWQTKASLCIRRCYPAFQGWQGMNSNFGSLFQKVAVIMIFFIIIIEEMAICFSFSLQFFCFLSLAHPK